MVAIKRIPRKNHPQANASGRYDAQAITAGWVDLERLAYLVSNQCTVQEADCLAVLHALQHNVMDELSQGSVVQLGTLGNFRVGVRSTGSDLPEEVTSFNVRRAHVNYLPGTRVRKMLKTLDYKLIGG